MNESGIRYKIYTPTNDPTMLRIIPILANQIGLDDSIVLLQIEYWISITKLLRDGKYWTYQSLRDMREKAFTWWSIQTISRIISRLEENELIFVGNYNKHAYDKTHWFSLNPKGLSRLKDVIIMEAIEYAPSDLSQNGTGVSQNGTGVSQNGTGVSQSETTIPETTTEITTINHSLVSPAFDNIPMPAYFWDNVKVSDDEPNNDGVGNELHPLELTIIEFCKDTGTKKLDPSHRKLLRSPVKFKYNGQWVEISPINAWDDQSFFNEWIENELLISLGNIIPKDESGKRKISRTKVVQYIRSQMHTFPEWQNNAVAQNSSESESVCEICHGEGYYFDEEWNQVKCSCGA
jgi:DNA-binding PadR family transcriptional regulator